MSAPRLRDAVRAVVVDPDDRVLLVHFEFPRVGWAAPGGGVDSGETDEVAIRRELAEEAGLEGVELGPVVWTRTHPFELGDWDGQVERYFFVAPSGPPTPTARADPARATRGARRRWRLTDSIHVAVPLNPASDS